MNPSTAAARAAVTALLRAGVRDVVLCPGSRSAPLAYALHAAETAGLLRLHVRHDERSAGFLALGYGKAAPDRPAAVVTTSGTAVANLHPAVLEAHHCDVPLVVLAADRPHELRGTWANQTTDLQAGLLAGAVRLSADVPCDATDLDRVVADAVAAATGCSGVAGGGRPGPVHVNVAFADPLTPDDDWSPSAPTSHGPPSPAASPPAARLEARPRTVVVAGDGAGEAARELAEAADWPLLAEPSSGVRAGDNAVGPYRLLLEIERLRGDIERIVAFGRPTLSRPVNRLLDDPGVELVLVGEQWQPGPARPAARVGTVAAPTTAADPAWLQSWLDAGAVATQAIDEVLDEEGATGRLHGPLVAREVVAALRPDREDVLVVAASNPVRDVDLAAHPTAGVGCRVLANRGLSGIDGTVSTAVGVALATGAPTRLLLGDLAFLHDIGALAVPAAERAGVRLQVVVLNDDGGGIFGLLEHGEPARAQSFERVFGTPHGTDLSALCAGFGVRHTLIATAGDLRSALADVPPGLSVVEVRADRTRLRELHARLRGAVRTSVERALAVRAAST